jgi:outer membrane protein OmpA-like peptidoglycan-associated protein
MRAILALSLALGMGAAGRAAQAQDTLGFQLQGTVYVHGDTVPITGAMIEVFGTDGSHFNALSDDKGRFFFTGNGQQRYINANTSYSIRVSAEDRLVVNDQVSTVGLTESTTFVKEYYLAKLNVIHDDFGIFIQFDRHSGALDQEGETMADIVAAMLDDNPTMVIELRGHCDANEDTILAVKRSEEVMHYLVKKGVEVKRIQVRRFGARESEYPAAELKDQTPEYHEKVIAWHRRVDIAAVSFDYRR